MASNPQDPKLRVKGMFTDPTGKELRLWELEPPPAEPEPQEAVQPPPQIEAPQPPQPQQPSRRFSIQEIAATFKKRYPQFADQDDLHLAKLFATNMPQFRDFIDWPWKATPERQERIRQIQAPPQIAEPDTTAPQVPEVSPAAPPLTGEGEVAEKRMRDAGEVPETVSPESRRPKPEQELTRTKEFWDTMRLNLPNGPVDIPVPNDAWVAGAANRIVTAFGEYFKGTEGDLPEERRIRTYILPWSLSPFESETKVPISPAMPGLGVIPTTERYYKLLTAFWNDYRGEASEYDEKIIGEYAAEEQAREQAIEQYGPGYQWGEAFVDTAVGLPGFASEFWATGGAYTATKALVRRGTQKFLKDRVKSATTRLGASRGLEAAALRASRLTAKGLGAAAGAGVHAIPLSVMRAPGDYYRNQFERVLSGREPDDFLPAATKTFSSMIIEAGTERMGGHFVKALSRNPIVRKFLWSKPVDQIRGYKEAALALWRRKFPQRDSVEFLNKVAKGVAWDGTLPEIFEEEIGSELRALFGLDPQYLESGEEYFEPSISREFLTGAATGDYAKIAEAASRFTVLAAAFALMPAGAYASATAKEALHRRRSRKQLRNWMVEQADKLTDAGVMPEGTTTEDIKGLVSQAAKMDKASFVEANRQIDSWMKTYYEFGLGDLWETIHPESKQEIPVGLLDRMEIPEESRKYLKNLTSPVEIFHSLAFGTSKLSMDEAFQALEDIQRMRSDPKLQDARWKAISGEATKADEAHGVQSMTLGELTDFYGETRSPVAASELRRRFADPTTPGVSSINLSRIVPPTDPAPGQPPEAGISQADYEQRFQNFVSTMQKRLSDPELVDSARQVTTPGRGFEWIVPVGGSRQIGILDQIFSSYQEALNAARQIENDDGSNPEGFENLSIMPYSDRGDFIVAWGNNDEALDQLPALLASANTPEKARQLGELFGYTPESIQEYVDTFFPEDKAPSPVLEPDRPGVDLYKLPITVDGRKGNIFIFAGSPEEAETAATERAIWEYRGKISFGSISEVTEPVLQADVKPMPKWTEVVQKTFAEIPPTYEQWEEAPAEYISPPPPIPVAAEIVEDRIAKDVKGERFKIYQSKMDNGQIIQTRYMPDRGWWWTALLDPKGDDILSSFYSKSKNEALDNDHKLMQRRAMGENVSANEQIPPTKNQRGISYWPSNTAQYVIARGGGIIPDIKYPLSALEDLVKLDRNGNPVKNDALIDRDGKNGGRPLDEWVDELFSLGIIPEEQDEDALYNLLLKTRETGHVWMFRPEDLEEIEREAARHQDEIAIEIEPVPKNFDPLNNPEHRKLLERSTHDPDGKNPGFLIFADAGELADWLNQARDNLISPSPIVENYLRSIPHVLDMWRNPRRRDETAEAFRRLEEEKFKEKLPPPHTLPFNFISGLQRSPSDIDLARKRQLNAPFGVAVDRNKEGKPVRWSVRVTESMVNHVANGGKLFIDSGAFTDFKKGRATEDWSDVFTNYAEILNSLTPQERQRVWIVAPDIVGNQMGTLDLQVELRDSISWFIDSGANVIVPWQKGTTPLAEFASEFSDATGDPTFLQSITIGIPFNEKAFSPFEVAEIANYLKAESGLQPVKIHLLGAGLEKTLNLYEELISIDNTIVLTGDASKRDRIRDIPVEELMPPPVGLGEEVSPGTTDIGNFRELVTETRKNLSPAVMDDPFYAAIIRDIDRNADEIVAASFPDRPIFFRIEFENGFILSSLYDFSSSARSGALTKLGGYLGVSPVQEGDESLVDTPDIMAGLPKNHSSRIRYEHRMKLQESLPKNYKALVPRAGKRGMSQSKFAAAYSDYEEGVQESLGFGLAELWRQVRNGPSEKTNQFRPNAQVPGKWKESQYAKKGHFQAIPIEFAEAVMEFPRDTPEDQAKIRRLVISIGANGLNDGIILSVDSEGNATIGEGNHRIKALKILGYKTVPARAYFHRKPLVKGAEHANHVDVRRILKINPKEYAETNGPQEVPPSDLFDNFRLPGFVPPLQVIARPKPTQAGPRVESLVSVDDAYEFVPLVERLMGEDHILIYETPAGWLIDTFMGPIGLQKTKDVDGSDFIEIHAGEGSKTLVRDAIRLMGQVPEADIEAAQRKVSREKGKIKAKAPLFAPQMEEGITGEDLIEFKRNLTEQKLKEQMLAEFPAFDELESFFQAQKIKVELLSLGVTAEQIAEAEEEFDSRNAWSAAQELTFWKRILDTTLRNGPPRDRDFGRPAVEGIVGEIVEVRVSLPGYELPTRTGLRPAWIRARVTEVARTGTLLEQNRARFFSLEPMVEEVTFPDGKTLPISDVWSDKGRVAESRVRPVGAKLRGKFTEGQTAKLVPPEEGEEIMDLLGMGDVPGASEVQTLLGGQAEWVKVYEGPINLTRTTQGDYQPGYRVITLGGKLITVHEDLLQFIEPVANVSDLRDRLMKTAIANGIDIDVVEAAIGLVRARAKVKGVEADQFVRAFMDVRPARGEAESDWFKQYNSIDDLTDLATEFEDFKDFYDKSGPAIISHFGRGYTRLVPTQEEIGAVYDNLNTDPKKLPPDVAENVRRHKAHQPILGRKVNDAFLLCNLLAATSPMNTVRFNLNDSLRILNRMKRMTAGAVQPGMLEIVGDEVLSRDPRWQQIKYRPIAARTSELLDGMNLLPAAARMVHEIWHGDTIDKWDPKHLRMAKKYQDAIDSGKITFREGLERDVWAQKTPEGQKMVRPKVVSFFHNLWDVEKGMFTTIDSHMARLVGEEMFGFGPLRTKAQRRLETLWLQKRLKGYHKLANRVRRVADRLGWEPHQAQSALWAAWRAKMRDHLEVMEREERDRGNLDNARMLRREVDRYAVTLDFGGWMLEPYVSTAIKKIYNATLNEAEDILYQIESRGQVKGATELLSKGMSVVHIFETGDPSTILHELFHVFFHEGLTSQEQKMVADIFQLGSLDEITVDQMELLARQWERYFYEGYAPSDGLVGIFEKFTQWLRQIYASITALGPPLSLRTRRLFDYMLAGTSAIQESDIQNNAQMVWLDPDDSFSLEGEGAVDAINLTAGDRFVAYEPGEEETIELEPHKQRRGIAWEVIRKEIASNGDVQVLFAESSPVTNVERSAPRKIMIRDSSGSYHALAHKLINRKDNKVIWLIGKGSKILNANTAALYPLMDDKVWWVSEYNPEDMNTSADLAKLSPTNLTRREAFDFAEKIINPLILDIGDRVQAKGHNYHGKITFVREVKVDGRMAKVYDVKFDTGRVVQNLRETDLALEDSPPPETPVFPILHGEVRSPHDMEKRITALRGTLWNNRGVGVQKTKDLIIPKVLELVETDIALSTWRQRHPEFETEMVTPNKPYRLPAGDIDPISTVDKGKQQVVVNRIVNPVSGSDDIFVAIYGHHRYHKKLTSALRKALSSHGWVKDADIEQKMPVSETKAMNAWRTPFSQDAVELLKLYLDSEEYGEKVAGVSQWLNLSEWMKAFEAIPDFKKTGHLEALFDRQEEIINERSIDTLESLFALVKPFSLDKPETHASHRILNLIQAQRAIVQGGELQPPPGQPEVQLTDKLPLEPENDAYLTGDEVEVFLVTKGNMLMPEDGDWVDGTVVSAMPVESGGQRYMVELRDILAPDGEPKLISIVDLRMLRYPKTDRMPPKIDEELPPPVEDSKPDLTNDEDLIDNLLAGEEEDVADDEKRIPSPPLSQMLDDFIALPRSADIEAMYEKVLRLSEERGEPFNSQVMDVGIFRAGQTLGSLVVPGIRLQDSIEAAAMFHLARQGEIGNEAFWSWVDQAKKENRIRSVEEETLPPPPTEQESVEPPPREVKTWRRPNSTMDFIQQPEHGDIIVDADGVQWRTVSESSDRWSLYSVARNEIHPDMQNVGWEALAEWFNNQDPPSIEIEIERANLEAAENELDDALKDLMGKFTKMGIVPEPYTPDRKEIRVLIAAGTVVYRRGKVSYLEWKEEVLKIIKGASQKFYDWLNKRPSKLEELHARIELAERDEEKADDRTREGGTASGGTVRPGSGTTGPSPNPPTSPTNVSGDPAGGGVVIPEQPDPGGSPVRPTGAAESGEPGDSKPVEEAPAPTEEQVGAGEDVGPGRDRRSGRQRASLGEETGDGYAIHVIQTPVPGAKDHISPTVEGVALAGTPLPAVDISKMLRLSDKMVTDGRLSQVQLEAIIYAARAFSNRLMSGYRQGFWVGDSTGMGKGRTAVGTILNEINAGSTERAVWVSLNESLGEAAKRDLVQVLNGNDAKPESYDEEGEKNLDLPFLRHHKVTSKKAKQEIINAERGLLYTTYGKLRYGFSDGNMENYNELVEFLKGKGRAEDFNGVIVFDESHAMKNAVVENKKGEVDHTEGSLNGQIYQMIAETFPNAKIMYMSATGATEVANMSYMSRLGLWGAGTPFANFEDFLHAMKAGGIAHLEMISRELKSTGKFVSRALSFEGVEFGVLPHKVSQEQKGIYNRMTGYWDHGFPGVWQMARMAAKIQKKPDMGTYWGAHQRFFLSMITSFQVDSLIDEIRADLNDPKNPKAVIVSLYNTNEASTNRIVERQGEEEDDVVVTPAEVIRLEIDRMFAPKYNEENSDNWFPAVIQHELVPARDKNGKLVQVSEAVTADPEIVRDYLDALEEKLTSDVPPKLQVIENNRAALETWLRNSVALHVTDTFSQSNMGRIAPEDIVDTSAVWPSLTYFETQIMGEKFTYVPGSLEWDDAEGRWMVELDNEDRTGTVRVGLLAVASWPSEDSATASIATGVLSEEDFAELVEELANPKPGPSNAPAGFFQRLREVLLDADLPVDENGEKTLAYEPQKQNIMEYLKQLQTLEIMTKDLPKNPIDRLIDEFGADNVAEISGRKVQVINGKVVTREGTAAEIRAKELDAFQNGPKNLGIISASAGFDLHADRRVKNQKQRVQYFLQLQWAADAFLQQAGRPHRSNQVVPPIFKLVESNMAGQKRLIAINAKRLAQLGAIGRGGRDAYGGKGIFDVHEDITDRYGLAALRILFRELNSTAPRIIRRMRVDPTKKPNSVQSKLLNRILALDVEDQNVVFERFYFLRQQLVKQAIKDGVYDTGIKRITNAKELRLVDSETLYTDPLNDTKTDLVQLSGVLPVYKKTFEEMISLPQLFGYRRNKRSGKIYVAYRTPETAPKPDGEGNEPIYRVMGVVADAGVKIGQTHLAERYDRVAKEEAKSLWDAEYAELPEEKEKPIFIVVGALIPQWDKIREAMGDEGMRFVRADLPNERLVGLSVRPIQAQRMRDIFGIESELRTKSADELFGMLQSGSSLRLDNGWIVGGNLRGVTDQESPRLEINSVRWVDPARSNRKRRYSVDQTVPAEELINLGFEEYTPEQLDANGYASPAPIRSRFFLPIDEAAAISVLDKLIALHRPVAVLSDVGEEMPEVVDPNDPDPSAGVGEISDTLGSPPRRIKPPPAGGEFGDLGTQTIEEMMMIEAEQNPNLDIKPMALEMWGSNLSSQGRWVSRSEADEGAIEGKYLVIAQDREPGTGDILNSFIIPMPRQDTSRWEFRDWIVRVPPGFSRGLAATVLSDYGGIYEDATGAVLFNVNSPDARTGDFSQKQRPPLPPESLESALASPPGELPTGELPTGQMAPPPGVQGKRRDHVVVGPQPPPEPSREDAKYPERYDSVPKSDAIAMREAAKTRPTVLPEEIRQALDNVARAAGRATAVYISKRMPKNARAFWKIFSEAIHLKYPDNFPDLAHELGHHLEKVIYGWGRGNIPTWERMGPVFLEEMEHLGYLLYGDTKPAGGYAAEGWAEFISHWVHANDGYLMSEAPRVYRWFHDDFLPAYPDVRDALYKARDIIGQYRLMNPLHRMKAQLVAYQSPLSKQFWTDQKRAEFSNLLFRVSALTPTVDEFQPLAEMQKEADKNVNRMYKEHWEDNDLGWFINRILNQEDEIELQNGWVLQRRVFKGERPDLGIVFGPQGNRKTAAIEIMHPAWAYASTGKLKKIAAAFPGATKIRNRDWRQLATTGAVQVPIQEEGEPRPYLIIPNVNSLAAVFTISPPEMDLSAKHNVFERASALRGTASGRIEGMINDHMISFTGVPLEFNGLPLRGLAKILGDIKKEDLQWEFILYLVGRRTIERLGYHYDPDTMDKPERRQIGVNEFGDRIYAPEYDSPITLPEAQSAIDAFDDIRPNKLFRRTAAEVYAWQEGLLRYMVDAGTLHPRELEAILHGSRDYIPLQRVFEFAGEMVNAIGQDIAKKGGVAGNNPLKRFKGSLRRIKDPFASILDNTRNYIETAHQRYVIDGLIEQYKNISGMGKWIERIPPDASMYTANMRAVLEQVSLLMATASTKARRRKKAFEEAYPERETPKEFDKSIQSYEALTEAIFNLEQSGDMGDALGMYLKFYVPKQIPGNSDKRAIVPYKNSQTGKWEWYTVHPRVFESLAGVNDIFGMDKHGIVLRLMAANARIFKLGTTGYRMQFSLITNPAKDIPTAMMQTKTTFAGKAGIVMGPLRFFSTWAHSHMRMWMAFLQQDYDAFEVAGLSMGWGLEITTQHGYDKFAAAASAPFLNVRRYGMEQRSTLNRKELQSMVEAHRLFNRRRWLVRLGKKIPMPRWANGRVIKALSPATTKSTMELLRELFQVPELTTRATEMRLRAKELGINLKKPETITESQMLRLMLDFKQVSVDFTAIGTGQKLMNQLIPFWNPQIQGTRAFLRAFNKHWKIFRDAKAKNQDDRTNRAMTALFALVMRGLIWLTGPTFLLWMYQKEEEWFIKAPPEDKWNYWWLDAEPVGGLPIVHQIPKPFEWGTTFTAPIAALDFYYNWVDEDAKDSLNGYLWHAVQSFAPFPKFHTATWFLEQAINMKFYTMTPLIPQNLENEIPLKQKHDYTSGVAIAAAETIASRMPEEWQHHPPTTLTGFLAHTLTSPIRLDHMVRNNLGATGTDIANVAGQTPLAGSFAQTKRYQRIAGVEPNAETEVGKWLQKFWILAVGNPPLEALVKPGGKWGYSTISVEHFYSARYIAASIARDSSPEHPATGLQIARQRHFDSYAEVLTALRKSSLATDNQTIRSNISEMRHAVAKEALETAPRSSDVYDSENPYSQLAELKVLQVQLTDKEDRIQQAFINYQLEYMDEAAYLGELAAIEMMPGPDVKNPEKTSTTAGGRRSAATRPTRPTRGSRLQPPPSVPLTRIEYLTTEGTPLGDNVWFKIWIARRAMAVQGSKQWQEAHSHIEEIEKRGIEASRNAVRNTAEQYWEDNREQ